MAGNYDKYGNYDFSMFEPKPVSFDQIGRASCRERV